MVNVIRRFEELANTGRVGIGMSGSLCRGWEIYSDPAGFADREPTDPACARSVGLGRASGGTHRSRMADL
jgi:hypothetical protein